MTNAEPSRDARAGRLSTIYALNAGVILTIIFSQILLVPVLLHTVGVGGFERWSVLVSIGAVCAILDIGLSIYNSNAVRIAFSANNVEEAQRLIGQGLFCYLFLFVLFILAAAIVFVAGISETPVALALMLLNTPFGLLRTWLSYILTAHRSQAWEQALYILYFGLQTVALACAGWIGGSIDALAWTNFASTLFLGLLPLFIALRRLVPEMTYTPRPVPFAEWPAFVKGCVANFGYAAASIATVHLPVILLGFMRLPEGTLAIFTTARTITGVVRQFCQQIARSNSIELSRLLALKQDSAMRRLFLFGATMIAIVAAAGLGGLWPIADAVLKVWTGKPELFDGTIISLFCVTTFLSAILQTPITLPQYTNKAHMMATPLALQVGLIVLIGLPAGYFLGSTGMVVALGIAELAPMTAVTVRKILPEFKLSFSDYTRVSVGQAFAFGALSGAASFLGKLVFEPHAFKELFLTGLVWTAIMGPALAIYFRWAKTKMWANG